MENKTHGGKRVGAGRKPLNLEKKMTITLYVPAKDTFPFGNAEKMKEKLYTFISSYNKEVSVQDLTKPTNEKKPFEQPKTNFTINTFKELSEDEFNNLNWKDQIAYRKQLKSK